MTRRFAVYNGNIHTLNPAAPQAQAVGILNGRIVAVGTNDEVRAALGPSEGLDLGGRTAVPGLIDAHVHFLSLSLALARVPLLGVTSIGEAIERVAARARETPDTARWITGGGWNYNFLGDNRWPNRADIDRVVPDHPVALSSHDHHSYWVNSKALQLAGITRDTPDPVDGVIQRDADGEPTGMLLEGAMRALREAMPQPTDEQNEAALVAGMREANRLGLTGVQSMENPQAFSALQRVRAKHGMTLRLLESIPADQLDHAIALGIRSGYGDEWLRLGHQKIFADGTVGSRTALMLEPYESEPDNYGIALTPREVIRDHIRRAAVNGIASTIHAIGDASNRFLLDIFEEAKNDGLGVGLRHRIEHAQLLTHQDIWRFAQLGVIPSMQPIHCTSDMFGIDRWWGERGRYAYVFETLRRSGAILAFGSDAPVDDLSPIAGIHAAVTRQNAAGEPQESWYPDECLDPYDALYAYTWGAAYASGEESIKGTLEVGKLGDLTVLTQDILAVPGREILNTEAFATIVDGRVVYGG